MGKLIKGAEKKFEKTKKKFAMDGKNSGFCLNQNS